MLGLAAIVAGPVLCGGEIGQSVSDFDGRDSVKRSIQEKVAEPQKVQRTPLFDNLPFLKLKAGDQLIKARAWRKMSKGRKAAFDAKESYFLLSEEKYYGLETNEWEGKLQLRSDYYSLLFDWDVTLANATMLQPDSDEAITPESFQKLKGALRENFPESLRDTKEIKIESPRLEGEGKSRRAIFQGLGFNRFKNTIFEYRSEIGNETYVQYRKDLIVGPSRVERREFEGEESHGMNGRGAYHPDPQTAARKRAEFDRMQKFQAIVNKFLVTPRVVSKGFG